jgi:hypothetical protein
MTGQRATIDAQIQTRSRRPVFLGRVPAHLYPDGSWLRSLTASAVAKHASLELANFAGAEFSRMKFTGMDLTRATLADADISYCNMNRATLTGADCRDAKATGIKLHGAALMGSTWDGARMEKADLREADLRGASFRRVDLSLALLPTRPAVTGLGSIYVERWRRRLVTEKNGSIVAYLPLAPIIKAVGGGWKVSYVRQHELDPQADQQAGVPQMSEDAGALLRDFYRAPIAPGMRLRAPLPLIDDRRLLYHPGQLAVGTLAWADGRNAEDKTRQPVARVTLMKGCGVCEPYGAGAQDWVRVDAVHIEEVILP